MSGSAEVRAPLDFDRLEVRGLSRHFGRRRALHDVTFTCRAGEIVALLGPNGAGKSTLLSILATLATPSSGTVRYGDADVASAGPAIRARLGVLGHDLHLYPELTARENLTFFGRLHGVANVDAAVARGLDRAGLTGRANDSVSAFSRGMRQRLALERALIHEPRLALLDEPFTGLDDASTQQLLGRVRALRDAGTIVILTTHDLDVIEGLPNRVVVIRDGKLVVCEEVASGLRARYRASIQGGSSK